MTAASNRPPVPAPPIPLGIVEGYFGTPWSFADRTVVMETLADWGFSRFTYAPKADRTLRLDWRQAHDEDTARALIAFAARCREVGVSFGIGLSPYGLHQSMDADGRAALERRVRELTALGASRIAIFFDDMRGDIPDLAARQAEIASWASAALDGAPLDVCPSYYSDDPVLDRVFGARPEGYERALGEALDARHSIYWTGPEVCAAEITPAHAARVGEEFARKPVLWDNYPVNDGPRMSRRLHLAGISGRRGLAPHLDAHDLNPALQPHLSLLPCATLAICYRDGDDYDYRAATAEAAHALYPEALAKDILETRLPLQDGGIEFVDRAKVRARFEKHDHPAAREMIRFANGAYQQTADDIETQ
ncbi:MAG: beta-N-acetylglucosaminidase domain-containing protein [Pacificimonas sp.]|nr:beta-N-acetylglucosaminidase domain-containing protein [Pacificimonas sp.]